MMVKEKQVRPSVDFCNECQYLIGDENGENYYQRCAVSNRSLKRTAECPVYCPKCRQAFAVHNDDGSCVED
jgi:hypothetical protein